MYRKRFTEFNKKNYIVLKNLPSKLIFMILYEKNQISIQGKKNEAVVRVEF